jgi:hypothetical protein
VVSVVWVVEFILAVGERQMAEPIHVSDWPMDSYPFRHPVSLEPVTSIFKVFVQDYDGRVEIRKQTFKDKDGNGNVVDKTVSLQPKQEFLTTGQGVPKKGMDLEEYWGMKDCIPAEDLRLMEERLGGKPSLVMMGLWAEWKGDRWVKTDMKKVASPLYYVDVTDKYYEKWRPAAYKSDHDPYEGQHRPYTRLQELALEKARLEKEAVTMRRDMDRMISEKNERTLNEDPVSPNAPPDESETPPPTAKKKGRPKKVS